MCQITELAYNCGCDGIRIDICPYNTAGKHSKFPAQDCPFLTEMVTKSLELCQICRLNKLAKRPGGLLRRWLDKFT